MTDYEAARKEIELAVLNFALDYHRFEHVREDVILKGIKSHPKFIDQILSLVEVRAENQDLPTNEDVPEQFREFACGAEDDSDNQSRAFYLLAQQDMLKPDKDGRYFVKVAPKPKENKENGS